MSSAKKNKVDSKNDWVIILFFTNVIFVIIGYGINTATNQAYLGPLKILRVILIAVGLSQLFRYFKYFKYTLPKKTIFFTVIYLLTLGSLFSYNITYSLGRTITFIFPILYIFLFLTYMINRYKSNYIWKMILDIINWTYIVPIIVFLIFDRTTSTGNLYGNTSAFVSNHYGWATALFILTSFDLLANYKIKKWRKIVIFTILPISFFLLIISGSRSSWVSILLAFFILIGRNKRIHTALKLIIIVFSTVVVSYFLQDKSSAIYARIEKTRLQMERNDRVENARVEWAEQAFELFNEKPHLYLTGLGLFNYEGLSRRGGYHNSYLEVFFGGGIIIFTLFILLFFFIPIFNYLIFYSKYLLLLPPLLIIPFFESNLTGGQFLFFPWFTVTLLMLLPPSYIKKN